jgi:hypothetical protein
MQIETGNVHKPKNNNVFLDDFEIEDIPFKPITDGLGFNNKSNDFKKPSVNQTRVHEKLYSEAIGAKPVVTVAEVPSELQAFYKEVDKTPKLTKNIDLTKKIEKLATGEQRLMSWVIDIVVISTLFAAVMSVMFVSTSFKLNEFIAFIKSDINMIFPVIIFALIHTIYGAVTGFRQSLGQKIVGVKLDLKSVNCEPVMFLIKRNILELISIPLLGIPFLFGLDKKLFGNKIIRA